VKNKVRKEHEQMAQALHDLHEAIKNNSHAHAFFHTGSAGKRRKLTVTEMPVKQFGDRKPTVKVIPCF
jgi:hypothetical protein